MGRHEPKLYFAGRHGSWSACACGRWRSRTYTTVTGAHIEFGQHLVDVARRERIHRRFLGVLDQVAARNRSHVVVLEDDDSPIRCLTCGTAQVSRGGQQ